MLDQVERVQHRLVAPAFAPQRMEVQRPVVGAITASPSIRDGYKPSSVSVAVG